MQAHRRHGTICSPRAIRNTTSAVLPTLLFRVANDVEGGNGGREEQREEAGRGGRERGRQGEAGRAGARKIE